MHKSLYDQLGPDGIHTIALLLGFVGGDQAGLRNNLREIQPVDTPYTYGDIMRVYAQFILTNVCKTK